MTCVDPEGDGGQRRDDADWFGARIQSAAGLPREAGLLLLVRLSAALLAVGVLYVLWRR